MRHSADFQRRLCPVLNLKDRDGRIQYSTPGTRYTDTRGAAWTPIRGVNAESTHLRNLRKRPYCTRINMSFDFERGSAGEVKACSRSVPTAVAGEITRASGLGERPAAPLFSCISVVISTVLAVLCLAPVCVKTTVSYIDPRRRAYYQYPGQSSWIVRPDFCTSYRNRDVPLK